jgi:hypothetical protein
MLLPVRQLWQLVDVDGDAAREDKEPLAIEMSPNPGPHCLGLISNSDKTGSGQEHDLSYRILVDAQLRQLGDAVSNLSRLILGHDVCRCASAGSGSK